MRGKNMTEKTTGIPELKNKKLLLVDDEPQLLSMLEQILYSGGFFQIYTAKTCKDALNIMEKQSISLCILDVNLPDGDGFYLFRTCSVRCSRRSKHILHYCRRHKIRRKSRLSHYHLFVDVRCFNSLICNIIEPSLFFLLFYRRTDV